MKKPPPIGQPAFKLACDLCGQIPEDQVELGDVQVHMVVEHGTTAVHLQLCWVGQPAPCPDDRWRQCQVDPMCYRSAEVGGAPHVGDCWVLS